MYVSTFADLSLLFNFQAIIKNIAFLQRTRIPGSVMRYIPIATWIILKYKFSTRGESNTNYIGFQLFGPKLWPKTLSFLSFSEK